MIKLQRVIKYFAVLIAGLLILSIINGIINTLFNIICFFSISNDNKELYVVNNEIKNIEIDVSNSNLIFKLGADFEIESSGNLNVIERNNKLFVSDKNMLNKKDIYIYIPDNYELDEVSIDVLKGNVDIKKMITNNLEMDVNLGSIKINELKTFRNCEIDLGVGNLDIYNANINNLDLKGGISNVSIFGNLNGVSEIEGGIGKYSFNLDSTISRYDIVVEKGLGKYYLNDKKINNNIINNGINKIEISGGIGNYNIISND